MASPVRAHPAAASPKRTSRPRVQEIKTGVDHTRGYTKQPHEYEHLITGNKLSGLLQSNLIYWIGRNTLGKESRPEWARLSITELARMCAGVERKSVSIALADLLKRGIIAAPVREGCAANTPKMYKLCPENWRKAPAYAPEVDADLLALARSVEAGWAKDGEEEEADAAQQTRMVDPGKSSKPQPIALTVKGSEPFMVRLVYHSEFDEPMAFRARAGRNGRLQVTACRPAANVVWGAANGEKADEGKAKPCSRGQLHGKDAFDENAELTGYRDYLRPLILDLWNSAKGEDFIRRVFEAAQGAPVADLQSQVDVRFARQQGIETFARNARKHRPGLLISLAGDAARAFRLREEIEKARPDKMATTQPAKPPEALNPSRRWDRIRAHLQTQLSQVSYDNWFAFTRQLEETEHTTTIGVQDETTAEYLKTEYGRAIEMAAAYLGEPVRFIWRVER